MLLRADGQNDPDILALNGASAALSVSDIPWAGPVGAVRVGRVNGEFVANPTHDQRNESDLDLVYVGTENDVIMIEGSAFEIPEEDFVKALEFAHGHAREMIRIQKELAAQIGKPKREMQLMTVNQEILEVAYQVAGDRIEGALYNEKKVDRSKAVNALKEEVKAAVLEKFPDADKFAISQAFDYVQKKAFRISVLDKQKRMDGRGYQDLRPITCEVGVLPRAHGSAIFQRGETQALALVTLAPIEEAQNIDAYGGGETSKSFLLHYSFPPFSVGETGRTGGASRREIGHGALAERSLEPVIPGTEDFRYAVRITSEIMESNGSSSMASVCGGMLALMDAGVPVKTPVAGISVGLVTEFGDGGESTFGYPGSVPIVATSPGSTARAKEIIGGMSRAIEVGQTYHGRVVSIKEFGAFVEVFPGKDGLVHISALADFRVKRTEDVAKIGEMIWVKCIGIDDKGRVKLSRKAALKERAATEAGQTTEPDRVEQPRR